MKCTDFDAVTFDCYGTLIDWETGLLIALRELFGTGASRTHDDRLLESFATHEARLEAGPYLPYRQVLEGVAEGMARDLGVQLTGNERARLPASVPLWPAFADTAPALASLAHRLQVGVISNVDNDLFAATAARWNLKVSWVVTAQQCGSYKPSPNNFMHAIQRHGLEKSRILHVAQSLFHDVAPARSLGIKTVWVDRRAGRNGSGATMPAAAQPDFRVTNLNELLELLGMPAV